MKQMYFGEEDIAPSMNKCNKFAPTPQPLHFQTLSKETGTMR